MISDSPVPYDEIGSLYEDLPKIGREIVTEPTINERAEVIINEETENDQAAHEAFDRDLRQVKYRRNGHVYRLTVEDITSE
jgi:hypothetical protein